MHLHDTHHCGKVRLSKQRQQSIMTQPSDNKKTSSTQPQDYQAFDHSWGRDHIGYWGKTNDVVYDILPAEQQLAAQIGLIDAPEALSTEAQPRRVTHIELRLRQTLGHYLQTWGTRVLNDTPKEDLSFASWAWASGQHTFEQHSTQKRQWVEAWLGIKKASEDEKQTSSEDEKQTSKEQTLFLDTIHNAQQYRGHLIEQLNAAIKKNKQYASQNTISIGHLAHALESCMRILKDAPDHWFEDDLNAKSQIIKEGRATPYDESKQKAPQTSRIQGNKDLYGAIYYLKQHSLSKEEKEAEKQKLRKLSKRHHHYHIFYSSKIAGLVRLFYTRPLLTTSGVFMTVASAMVLYYPAATIWSGSQPILASLANLLHCNIFAIASFVFMFSLVLIWGGLFVLSEHVWPKLMAALKTDNQRKASANPIPHKRIETEDTNVFACNPVARFYSGLRFIFTILYDHGRSNPGTMSLFGLCYWFPTILLLMYFYGGYHGLFTPFIQHVLLPMHYGMVSHHAAPWFGALCVGFLFGKGIILLCDILLDRKRSGVIKGLIHCAKTIIDSVLGLFGLMYLAVVMACFPALAEECGSWRAFNFITLTIKPVAVIYDIYDNFRRSIIGSPLHCIVVVPLWIVFGSNAHNGLFRIHVKDEEKLDTIGKRLKRAGSDLWQLLKMGLFEITLGLPVRDILFGVMHVMWGGLCKTLALTFKLFRLDTAASWIHTMEIATVRVWRNVFSTLGNTLKQALKELRLKHFVLVIALAFTLPSALSLLYAGHLLHLQLWHGYQHLLSSMSTLVPGHSVLLIAAIIPMICAAFLVDDIFPALLPIPQTAKNHPKTNARCIFVASLAMLTVSYLVLVILHITIPPQFCFAAILAVMFLPTLTYLLVHNHYKQVMPQGLKSNDGLNYFFEAYPRITLEAFRRFCSKTKGTTLYLNALKQQPTDKNHASTANQTDAEIKEEIYQQVFQTTTD